MNNVYVIIKGCVTPGCSVRGDSIPEKKKNNDSNAHSPKTFDKDSSYFIYSKHGLHALLESFVQSATLILPLLFSCLFSPLSQGHHARAPPSLSLFKLLSTADQTEIADAVQGQEET